MPDKRVKPEVIDYFCKGCEGMRLHILGPRRYHCGSCDRQVSVAEIATNYSVSADDADIMLITDPFERRLTNAAERGIIGDALEEDDDA